MIIGKKSWVKKDIQKNNLRTRSLRAGRVSYNVTSSSRGRKSKVKLALLVTFLLVGSISALLFYKAHSKENKTEQQQATSTEVKPQESSQKSNEEVSFDIAAVGDMLPHETVTKAAKTSSSYDYLSLISPELKQSFQKAPVRFCNQEAPSAPALGVRGYPAFNAPAEFPKDLSTFGCNVISLANNHLNDSGQAGIDGTVDEWSKQKTLAISGANKTSSVQQQLQTFEVNGIKFGFVAFNEINNKASASSYSVNMLGNSSLLESQIKELKSKTDLVIVSVHWGQDGSHKILSSQSNIIKKISDLGADLIIGSGPHVWQPYQVITKADGTQTHVWYSLGNGLSSQVEQAQLFSGVALMRVTKTKDSKPSLSSPRVLPTYMHYVWTNGIGLAQSQLLGRKDLQWTILPGSADLISKRNDFKTSEEEQTANLKKYLNNDLVEILNSY